MTLPEHITPSELAKQLGWAEKRVRQLARRLGACRVLGNRMIFLPEDVRAIMEATKPCPSKSIDVREAMSGTTGARLPEIDSVDLLAHLCALRNKPTAALGGGGKMALNDQQKEALRCLSDGYPKWGKDIAEHMGMTAWSQISTGTVYGNQLVAKGMATKRMQRGEPFGMHRAYFYITDAGKEALQQTRGA